MTVQTQLIINGEWRAPSTKQYDDVINPASPDTVVGRCAAASREDVRAAIEAAESARADWQALGIHERAKALRRIVEAVKDEVEARARLLTQENGKLLKESMMEMTRLGDRFTYTATLADELANEETYDAPPHRTVITYQPFGVTALIVPYNWPLSILGAKLPQALLAGNTVVIKAPPTAPLAMMQTLKMMADALPPGVLNAVTGPVDAVGGELLEHRLVRKVDFTGSVRAGKYIMSRCSETLKHVTLELGGNDAAIVLDDASIDDAAISRMAMGAFLTAGQICMAMKRLYVHRSLFDRVHEGLTAALDRFVVGDGLAEESTMGPVNNRNQLDIVRGMVSEAERRGARVQALGRARDQQEFDRGFFHLPTLVTGADSSFRVVSEEQFGPVLPIIPFDDEQEAIRLANDSEMGLCSSVWSADLDRAERVARQIEAGYTYINIHGPMGQDNRGPFGGFKESGIGRELGRHGVYAFLEPHTISFPGGR
jgi:acyl-CoA reductase-like NAD-dependent aldehyde dehydrogenase